MKKIRPSIHKMFLLNMTAVAIASIILLGTLWIRGEYGHFKAQTDSMRTEYLANQKALIKNDVERVVAYIEFMNARTEQRLKQSIKGRVYEAHAIATNFYQQYRDTKSRSEIQKIIKDALRVIRFNNGRGYYFAVNLNGIEELNADKPEMEGHDMRSVLGGNGKYVVGDMILMVNTHVEGFYEYQWSKPGALGRNHRKIAFVKLFEPYNWFIGTGGYVDDAQQDVQQEVLSKISKNLFGQDEYIFVGDWDGVSLVGPAKGRNMLHVTDANGVRIVRKLITAAKAGGGFISYVLPNFKGKKSAPKISYSKGIKEWGWYVGAGAYLDEIETAIAQTRHHYIAGNLLDAIWVIDVDTLRFEYITPSIEQITGYTADQYIQLTIKDRLTNSAFEGAIKVLTEGKAKFERGIEVKRKLKLELIHKNGYPYWIEISAKLFRDLGGVLKIVGITREITKQKKAEMQKDALIIKLQEALAEKERLLKENKVLRGLLPVCSGCKRIRDNKGNWWPLDAYIAEHTEADITHTICGDCKTALYGDLDDCRHAKSA